MERKTPLYDLHVELGGRIVPFAGYLLPVQYPKGVIHEHMAVREGVGLFDVSHMGEVRFEGAGALKALNHLMANDMTGMVDGQVRYSPMLNEEGGIVDDLVVCRFDDARYMAVVNAANREKDVNWMRENLFGDCQLTDMSDDVAQLALQGPKAEAVFAKVCDQEPPAGYYTFIPEMTVAGVKCLVSRTGYTGEDGFELYCANADAPALWNALLEAGKDDGLIPCGLGARDTLRLEAAMPLYGHEMDDTVSPFETGLGWAVKMHKDDFIGKAALAGNEQPARRRVGIEITGRGIAREHCDMYLNGKKIGVTTSGTHCPYLGKAVAMALIDGPAEDGALTVDVRGRQIEAKFVPLPFYQRKK